MKTIDKIIHETLTNLVPNYSKLTKEKSKILLVFVNKALFGYHLNDGGLILHSKYDLQNRLGNRYKSLIDDYFERIGSYRFGKNGNYCYRYILKDFLEEAIWNNYYAQLEQSKKNEQRRSSNAFLVHSAADVSNVKAIRDKVPAKIQINCQAINCYESILKGLVTANDLTPQQVATLLPPGFNTSKFTRDSVLKYLNILERLRKFASLSAEGNSIFQKYSIATTGRLVGVEFHLQRIPSTVRLMALSGMELYDYDVDNAHYTILYYLFNKNTTPRDDAIAYYLNNKTYIRNQLAQTIGVEISKIKQFLASIIYGSRLNWYYKNATYLLFNKEQHKTIMNDVFVKELISLVAIYRQHIINSHVNNDTILNKANRTFLIKKGQSSSSKLAFILQGYERCLLDYLINAVPEQSQVVLLHDGIICKRFNKTLLEQKIESEIGIQISIKESVVPTLLNGKGS